MGVTCWLKLYTYEYRLDKGTSGGEYLDLRLGRRLRTILYDS